MQKIIIYTDGGSRGNPGPSAIGVVLCDEKGKAVKGYSELIGVRTNNEAEYEAVIFALKKVKALYGKKAVKDSEVEVRADSELLIKQLNGEYKIIEPKIQALFLKTWNLKIDFNKIKFICIPREKNKEADSLVNQALDNQAKNQTLF
ncbi:MAG: ribonuclease HI family protein [Candidatus Nealsonbacteria bacterium]|nr:ribonuclease HI family protein [Candidatus Nealsonbacteria bacterium]